MFEAFRESKRFSPEHKPPKTSAEAKAQPMLDVFFWLPAASVRPPGVHTWELPVVQSPRWSLWDKFSFPDCTLRNFLNRFRYKNCVKFGHLQGNRVDCRELCGSKTSSKFWSCKFYLSVNSKIVFFFFLWNCFCVKIKQKSKLNVKNWNQSETFWCSSRN